MNPPSARDPLVTVYVTSYNYEKYVAEAIDSVLAQSFADFELLIIDDGSTDGSREIIERYREEERVRILFQENKGLNATNNIAVRAARGRYVMRVDADDFLDPNALLVMVNALEKEPDVALVFPDYYYVDAGGRVTGQERRHNFNKEVTLLDQPAHGACTLFRRNAMVEVGAYSGGFTCQDGVDLWLKMVERYPVRNVNLPLFYYRRHGENLTENSERILKTRAAIYKAHAERTERPPLNTIAVLPVRGPSMDRRDLSLYELGGQALIDWTVKAALASDSVAELIVTTPDEAVLQHLEATFGEQVTLHARSKKQALENVSFRDAVLAALQQRRTDGPLDAVLELTALFPFRDAVYIDKAVDAMRIFGVDRVVSVFPEDDVYYQHDGNGLQALRNNGSASGLRLERDYLYRQAGGINLYRGEAFTTDEIARTGHIVLTKQAAMKVANLTDLSIAKLLMGRARR